jgi:hypothetical protein
MIANMVPCASISGQLYWMVSVLLQFACWHRLLLWVARVTCDTSAMFFFFFQYFNLYYVLWLWSCKEIERVVLCYIIRIFWEQVFCVLLWMKLSYKIPNPSVFCTSQNTVPTVTCRSYDDCIMMGKGYAFNHPKKPAQSPWRTWFGYLYFYQNALLHTSIRWKVHLEWNSMRAKWPHVAQHAVDSKIITGQKHRPTRQMDRSKASVPAACFLSLVCGR